MSSSWVHTETPKISPQTRCSFNKHIIMLIFPSNILLGRVSLGCARSSLEANLFFCQSNGRKYFPSKEGALRDYVIVISAFKSSTQRHTEPTVCSLSSALPPHPPPPSLHGRNKSIIVPLIVSILAWVTNECCVSLSRCRESGFWWAARRGW